MQKSEAKKLVSMLVVAYQSQLSRLGVEQLRQTAEIYADMLADLDFAVARAAVERLLATAKFLPTIAEIREAALEVTAGPRRHGGDAWRDVLEAVSRYGRNRLPSFDDAVTAACVRSLGWQEICNSENQVADRARFIELYDKLAREQRVERVAGGLPAQRALAAQRAQGGTHALGDATARALAVLAGGKE